jgi:hypothetical protein
VTSAGVVHDTCSRVCCDGVWLVRTRVHGECCRLVLQVASACEEAVQSHVCSTVVVMPRANNGVVWCGVVWCGVVWCGVVW